MKCPFLLATALFCPLFSALAATDVVSTEASPKPVYANILAGDLKVGGGFDISYGDRQATTISLSPSVEYFVADHLSVGGGLTLSHVTSFRSTTWSIGPTATYYFWSQDRIALFFSQGIFVSHSSEGTQDTVTYASSTSQLGADYFIIPSVAFGPALQWRHAFSESTESADIGSQNTYSLIGRFAIHL